MTYMQYDTLLLGGNVFKLAHPIQKVMQLQYLWNSHEASQRLSISILVGIR